MSRIGEFEFIAQSLAPLSAGYEGAFGLTDDAALLAQTPGLVVTSDTLVQGVHFRNDDPMDLIARKALRVNISDLVAMAAKPHAFLLSIVWPESIRPEQQNLFVEGLAFDIAEYSVPLIGGDTTRGGDRLVLTITAFGETEAPLRRSGARPGDRVFVSGTIGDAGLGLHAAEAGLPESATQSLNNRYLLPEPRVGLIKALRQSASAGLDISDGLVADAGHLARASDVALDIRLEDVPLSDAARLWLSRQNNQVEAWSSLLTGGDDYEMLFCVPEHERQALLTAAQACGVSVTEIGEVAEGKGVQVTDESGQIVQILRTGFTHF
ncbi:thiamine-phosphate kinase [Hyphobacterium sp.]|uniref:thiamine-phosphate kinase n=1 Tax=Hyphobacterium sp. TaxID=2004662 RepID=UPI0037487527